ncbi:MAG: DUF4976 domain-containing protein, partial [bacterium]|nr:DUF4976 domain-containing protein [bacterium]
RPGTSTKQLMESVDIFPTLNELAGIPPINGPQSIDGLSMAEVIKEPSKRIRNHAFHAYPKAKMGRAIRTEQFRMVEWKKKGKPTEYELYDYSDDPYETKNIAAEKPTELKKLQAILAKYPEPKGRR